MTTREAFDLILERLDKIEERLDDIKAKLDHTATWASMDHMATAEDLREVAQRVDAALDEITEAEKRRELNQMRAELRGRRAS